MKRSKIFLLTIILFLFASSVFAQQKSYEITTYKDELYGKPIGSIIIGLDGKLWMGGMGEVSRLDGTNWTTFTADEELSDKIIYPMIIGPNGELWLSGTGEVYRIEGDTWSTFTADEELSGKTIYPKAIGNNGVLWCTSSIIGSMNVITVRFDGETWTTFSLVHEGMNALISNVVVDPDGVVWAGGEYGVVFYYKDDTWTKTIVDFALGNVIRIKDLAINPDGVVYAATNGGVYMYKDGKWINTYGPEGMEQDDANVLGIQPGGKVWVGTYLGNVSCFDGENWTTIVEGNDKTWRFNFKAISNLKSIIEKENEYYAQHGEYVNFEFGEDCEEIGWKARYYEGFTTFKCDFHDSIATALEALDLNEDGDTNDGLTLSVSGIEGIITGSDITWKTRFGKGPSGYDVSSIAFGSYGDVWVKASSFFEEVFMYDNGTWIQYTSDDDPDDKPTSIIGIASDNVIWLTSKKGVWQLIPTSTLVETDDNIPSEFAITGNYPNPFNPKTTIEFSIPETGFINLSIYNITGQKIRELAADTMTAGTHSVVWDGKDENGMIVSSGIYLSRLRSGEHIAAGRMLLMK